MTDENSACMGVEEFFSDPLLVSYISEGLAGNQELKILAENIRIADAEVLRLLVGGLVGHGPAIEFLRFAESADLPDPESLLTHPDLLETGARTDLLLAALASVSTAVAGDCTQERWNAAWDVLQVACEGGRADVAAIAADSLISLRSPDWPAPAAAAAFAPVLRAAQLV